MTAPVSARVRGLRTRPRTVLGASLGDCVHVAGLLNFLRLAEQEGYVTTYLGPAVSVAGLVEAIRNRRPGLVAISYRLSPEAAAPLFRKLAGALRETGLAGQRFVLGGTDPVCRVGEESGLFEAVFGGSSTAGEVRAYLRGEPGDRGTGTGAAVGAAVAPAAAVAGGDTLVDRITRSHPVPLLRHHYGRPTLAETVAGVREIALAGVLDVVSLGPDQNAQEFFFRPELMDPAQDGAGGVPVRSPDDFRALYEASRCGNYPLLRCYSGTQDTLEFAALLQDTIRNAWCAVPLFWYNVLDGRSRRLPRESIAEAQAVMRWHARRGIPVEVNEAHHWSLRAAPDAVAVAAAYLAAYNARAAGVGDYVAQFMFNTPPGTSPAMDLAKMLAALELIEGLAGPGFRVWRQVRAGLSSFPAEPHLAMGHLASSTTVQMALRPHIVHVVGYTEADHAAMAEEVIASCRIARGAIDNALAGLPEFTTDPRIEERRAELVAEARLIIDAIRAIGANSGEARDSGRTAGDGSSTGDGPSAGDPLTDPAVLARAVEVGILDAPHLVGNPHAAGRVVTAMVEGSCRAVDSETGMAISEEERLRRLVR